MRNLLILAALLLSMAGTAQEDIALRFTRPRGDQGTNIKFKIRVLDSMHEIGDGETITFRATPSYTSAVKVECMAPKGAQSVYFFNPDKGNAYLFEVGYKPAGVYIKQLSQMSIAEMEREQPSPNAELLAPVVEKAAPPKELPNTVVAETVTPHTPTNTNVTEAAPVQTPPDTITVKKDTTIANEVDTNIKINRKKGSIALTSEQIHSSDTIRQAWLEKGGKIRYDSYLLTALYFRMDIENYGPISGYGGGYSVAQNWIDLKIPQYKTGLSTWSSLNMGYGLDMNLFFTDYTMEMESLSTKISSLNISMLINGNFGWTIGLGKFLDEANWKGVALTLKYRPSINMTNTISTIEMKSDSPYFPDQTTSDSNTDIMLNMAGLGFDIEFSNFTATMAKIAPKPKSKFAFFLLPPIGDNPLFVSVSFGMTIYSR
ncbi:MAG: hypothetical protein JW783_02250 [Bacteroidales bacterium]|nr:hypothetical protein [Bacteroidales bacterium]MBN2750863.1 hypothetical protein [Bacteroidales bacterium]